jgi:DNA-binding transcriptional regulator YhcF (GntR family)
MAAEIENDRWESVRKLAQDHDVSARTVHGALRIT